MSVTLRTRIGAKDLVYALLTESSDVSGGTPSYGAVKSLATLAKMSLNPGSSAITEFFDDGAGAIGETTGKIQPDITLYDIDPSAYAELLGISYANGIVGQNTADQSPYVAIGWKVLHQGSTAAAPDYDYWWLYKCKFMKPDHAFETKADTLKPNLYSLKGEAAKLAANGYYASWCRTTDTNLPAATVAGWFSQVTLPAPDLTALTMVAATGTGATKTFILTFSKASSSAIIPFTISASSIAALVNQLVCVKNSSGALLAITAAISIAGTGFSNSPVVVTVTSASSTGGDVISVGIGAGSDVVDSSGVAVTAYANGGVTLHA